jgi:AraC-like DNA-binding protein
VVLMQAWSRAEWEDILSRSFVPLATPVTEPNFSGSADHHVVGEGVALTAVRTGACRAERTCRHIAASNDDYVIFSMQLKGVCNASQQGRAAHVTAGRGVLYTTGLPWSQYLPNANESLAIQVPRERLGLSRRLITHLTALTVDSTEPGFRLVSKYAAALFDESGSGDRSAYGRIAVDLLAGLVWQMANDTGTAVKASEVHLARLQRLARENIADPRLDVSLLALKAGVSVRTVYSAFATIGLTPAEYIRRQRLEAAAARLSSSGVSIMDIAISVGFADVTTFTRCFKRRYGVTPSQWRGAAR